MASPTPVLPEVPSTMVDPGLRRPSRSAALDHRRSRPVLDAPTRVEELELPDQGAGEVPAHPVETDHGGVADQVEERVGDFHRRPTIGEGHDLDAEQVLAVREVLVGVQLGRQPGTPQVHGDLGRAWSDDRHVPWDTRPDVGDQRWRDIGERQRDDVVRPGGQSLGRLVGSDDDEHVHGDMLVHLRRLCLGTGPAQCVGRGRPVRWGGRASASGGPAQCVGRAGPS